jgi:hypothetical protein
MSEPFAFHGQTQGSTRYNNSQLEVIQGRAIPSPPPPPSTAIPKHRENFTIRMPPMATQSNTNQMSQGEITVNE